MQRDKTLRLYLYFMCIGKPAGTFQKTKPTLEKWSIDLLCENEALIYYVKMKHWFTMWKWSIDLLCEKPVTLILNFKYVHILVKLSNFRNSIQNVNKNECNKKVQLDLRLL